MRNKQKSMTYVSMGAVFITIGSWITVPFAIPFTMQTFAVFFVLKAFGGKIGGMAVLLHIAMGLLGLPVFSGFKSGISALLGPTGGYIMGFALVGALYFVLYSILNKESKTWAFLPFVSLAVCYGFGTAWCMSYISAEADVGLVSALSMCVLPYIIPDVVKITLASAFSKRLRKSFNIS